MSIGESNTQRQNNEEQNITHHDEFRMNISSNKACWVELRVSVAESARVKRLTKPSHYIISHCFSNETMPNFNSVENFMEYYFIAQSKKLSSEQYF